MKCPNCGFLKKKWHNWCEKCGTHATDYNIKVSVPDYIRWRKFKDEPPPLTGSNIKDYMDIQAASRGMEPGEFYIDMAGYNIHSSEYERDYFNGTKIEWWRPIGPMPKMEES